MRRLRAALPCLARIRVDNTELIPLFGRASLRERRPIHDAPATGNDIPVPERIAGLPSWETAGNIQWIQHVSILDGPGTGLEVGLLSPISRQRTLSGGHFMTERDEHGPSSDHYIRKPDESAVPRARGTRGIFLLCEALRLPGRGARGLFLEYEACGLLFHRGERTLRWPARRMCSGELNSGEEVPQARTTPRHARCRWLCTPFSGDNGSRALARNCLPTGQTNGRGRIVARPLGRGGCPRFGETGFPGSRAGLPRVKAASSARHRIVSESDGLRSDRSGMKPAEGAFLSKEGGSSKGEAQEAGPPRHALPCGSPEGHGTRRGPARRRFETSRTCRPG